MDGLVRRKTGLMSRRPRRPVPSQREPRSHQAKCLQPLRKHAPFAWITLQSSADLTVALIDFVLGALKSGMSDQTLVQYAAVVLKTLMDSPLLFNQSQVQTLMLTANGINY